LSNQYSKQTLANILTKEYLEKEYVQKRRFIKDISLEVGCSLNSVRNYLKKYNIDIENRYEDRQTFKGLNPARKIMTKVYLKEEYVHKNRSLNNIARELNCSSALVKEMLLTHGIKVDKLKYGETFELCNGVSESHGYLLVYMPNHRLADKKGYVRLHILLAEHYFNRLVKKGEVVHHKNFNKLDNTPDNLVIMTKKEHDRLHAQLRWDNDNFR
jgi:DNA-binding transcriptional MerR regulator